MPAGDFHEKPFDEGTLTKLRVFELYTQEWIPVFLSKPHPLFKEVHLFDFFSGPGTDSKGMYGSPLRILDQLCRYHQKGLAGWDKAGIVAHLFDEDDEKIASLKSLVESDAWKVPGVRIDCRAISFHDALAEHEELCANPATSKLLIIDQYGVDQVSEVVFRKLVSFQTTDFIFFLSSSTLHRFREHPAIKQKIEKPEDSYDVHRAALKYYRGLIPADDQLFLGPFSIRKQNGNIYGLIFGSHHPLGIHKFLQVAWSTDEIAGEANFDIERENVRPEEGILPLDVMRPRKIQEFEARLEIALRSGGMKSEADMVRFCIEAGMMCKHSESVLKKLKAAGVISADFHVPDVRKMRNPRPIRTIL
jgi:three-Cys-motif partner protein